MDYVIVTPAYNEAAYITQTSSVLAQTRLPKRWVIVDDGSTDNTAEIVNRYAAKHLWIKYIFRRRIPEQSYYASNVHAIARGVAAVRDVAFGYLAILDADITLPHEYYATMLQLLSADPKLGIVSGNCVDRIGEKRKRHLYDRRSCPKAIMVFRRQCYEDIGGFVPMKYGGEDTCACFMARMKGWKTWACREMLVEHNKPLGTGPSRNFVKIRFRQGIGEYYLASHPLFFVLKCLRRCVMESPLVIGGAARLAGYMYAHFLAENREIPDELATYIRREQLLRIMKGNAVPRQFRSEAI